jgi:hypothetical protein
VLVEGAARPGDERRQRVREVAVAAVAEAVPGHVDRRPEGVAVEQRRELPALVRVEHRVGDGEALRVEAGLKCRPVERVDAPGDGGLLRGDGHARRTPAGAGT